MEGSERERYVEDADTLELPIMLVHNQDDDPCEGELDIGMYSYAAEFLTLPELICSKRG